MLKHQELFVYFESRISLNISGHQFNKSVSSFVVIFALTLNLIAMEYYKFCPSLLNFFRKFYEQLSISIINLDFEAKCILVLDLVAGA